MRILTVIPFFADQSAKAERLLDAIYWCGGQKQCGHVLLVPAPDVHSEFKTKARIAAEVGFEGVDMYEPKVLKGKSSTEKSNSLFSQTAAYIAKTYRWPWLWLEPNCVPLKSNWMKCLESAYEAQPKAYFGPHMRVKRGQMEQLYLSRTSIYPVRAIIDVEKHCDGVLPFEQAAVEIVQRSTKNRLIQRMDFDGDRSKLRDDAVLLDGDASGELIEKMIEESVAPKRPRGRPRRILETA